MEREQLWRIFISAIAVAPGVQPNRPRNPSSRALRDHWRAGQ